MSGKFWSKEELQYLETNCNIKSRKEIAEYLNRTIESVNSKLNRVNFTKLTKLEQLNAAIALKYPHLQFITYEGCRVNSVIKDTTCGHTWEVRSDYVKNRGIGVKCPVCNTNNRKKTTESLLSNIQALGYSQIISIGEYTNSKIPVEVKYICGHTTSVEPNSLLNKGTKNICRECYPQKTSAKLHDEFYKELQEIAPNLTLLDRYTNGSTYLDVKSEECGHIWKINPHNFLQKRTLIDCPNCKPKGNGFSGGELELYEWLKNNYTGEVIKRDRSVLSNFELDIFLPELNLAIEYNGEYWHSNIYKDKHYHIDKTNKCLSKGIKLVHIFEHEWKLKASIVKSRLASILGNNYSIGARACIVKEITFPKEFLEENHLQGAGSPTKVNLGLFTHKELVAVMTFSKPRFTTKYEYELVRYCSLLDINVVGGASKLFKHFTKTYKPASVISYSDKCWGLGGLYKHLGFSYSHTSEPGYFYFKNFDIISRYKAQKHKLQALFPNLYDPKLTEAEIMGKAKYIKVYDCGNDVWEFIT